MSVSFCNIENLIHVDPTEDNSIVDFFLCLRSWSGQCNAKYKLHALCHAPTKQKMIRKKFSLLIFD